MQRHITRREFEEALADINERMNTLEASVSSQQQQLDADTAAILKIGTDLATSVAAIQTELNSLQQANPQLDLSHLEAAITEVDAQAQAVAQLVPQAPAPPPPAPAGPTKAVYTFSGDASTIDAASWPASGFETTETPPRLLYYFSGDTAAGQTNGNGQDNGAWVVYTGATQATA